MDTAVLLEKMWQLTEYSIPALKASYPNKTEWWGNFLIQIGKTSMEIKCLYCSNKSYDFFILTGQWYGIIVLA